MKQKAVKPGALGLVSEATRKLFSVLREEKKEIWLLYAYAIISGLINLSLPLGVQAIITYLMGAYLSTSLVLLIVLVIAGTFFVGLLQLFQLSIVELLQQRLFMRSTLEYAFRIPLLRLASTGKYLFEELANRFFDTLTLQKQVPKLLMDLSAAILQMFFGLILISFYHPFFAFFSLLLILLLFLFFRYSGPRGLASSLEESEEKYRIAHTLQSLGEDHWWYRSLKPFRSGLRRIDSMLKRYLDARNSHFRVLRAQYRVLILFKTLIISILLIIGGNLVLGGQINLGQFIAAEIVIILILGSVEKMLLSMEGIYDVLTAVEKVAKVPELPIDAPEGYVGEVPEKLEFRNAVFRFGNRTICRGLNLNLNLRSNRYWISKDPRLRTLFIRTLQGAMDPHSGAVVVDGVNLSDWNLLEWRQHVQSIEIISPMGGRSLSEILEVNGDSERKKQVIELMELLELRSTFEEFGLSMEDPISPLWWFNNDQVRWKIGLMRSVLNEAHLLLFDLHQFPQGILNAEKFSRLQEFTTANWWVFGDDDLTLSGLKREDLDAEIREKGGDHA